MSRIYTVPSEFHPTTKQFMRQIVKALLDNSELEKEYLTGLHLLGNTFNDYILVRQQIASEGLFTEDNTQPTLPGMEHKGINKVANLKANPALKLANELHNQVLRLLVEYNLTPKARKKPEPLVEDDAPEIEHSPIDRFIKVV